MFKHEYINRNVYININMCKNAHKHYSYARRGEQGRTALLALFIQCSPTATLSQDPLTCPSPPFRIAVRDAEQWSLLSGPQPELMLQTPPVPGVGLLTASLSFQEEKMHEHVSISLQRTASVCKQKGRVKNVIHSSHHSVRRNLNCKILKSFHM